MPLGPLAVAAYLLLIPLASIFVDRVSGHDLARMTQVALFVVCSAQLLARVRVRPAWAPARGTAIAAAAAVALATASILTAARPGVAWRETAVIAGLVAVAWCVQQPSRFARRWPAIAAIATALYASLLCLLVIANLVAGVAPSRLSLFIGYDNYRFYNHVQTVALPLSLVAAATAPSRWVRVWATVALVCGVALLLASGGRGTALALLAAALTMAVLGGRRSGGPLLIRLALSVAAGLGLFLLLFVAVPGVLAERHPDFADYRPDRLTSDQARWPLWAAARDMALSAPWLGAGPGHYALLPGLKAAHPHNVYLQLAAEWGLPMALLAVAGAIALLVRLAAALRRTADPGQHRNGVVLAGAWVAVLVDGLVSGNFVMPVSQVWIAVLVGWAWRWSREVSATPTRDGSASAARPSIPRWLGSSLAPAAAVAVAALTLWLAVDVWPQATDLSAHLDALRLQAPGARENPRFWSNGRP